jgi:hypothetical protein
LEDRGISETVIFDDLLHSLDSGITIIRERRNWNHGGELPTVVSFSGQDSGFDVEQLSTCFISPMKAKSYRGESFLPSVSCQVTKESGLLGSRMEPAARDQGRRKDKVELN